MERNEGQAAVVAVTDLFQEFKKDKKEFIVHLPLDIIFHLYAISELPVIGIRNGSSYEDQKLASKLSEKLKPFSNPGNLPQRVGETGFPIPLTGVEMDFLNDDLIADINMIREQNRIQNRWEDRSRCVDESNFDSTVARIRDLYYLNMEFEEAGGTLRRNFVKCVYGELFSS